MAVELADRLGRPAGRVWEATLCLHYTEIDRARRRAIGRRLFLILIAKFSLYRPLAERAETGESFPSDPLPSLQPR